MRVVYSRPFGGLNDTLCQIRKAWVFARDTGRTLALDTRESGLLLSFPELFDFVDQSVPIMWDPDEATLTLWSKQTVQPTSLQNAISEFFAQPFAERFLSLPEAEGAIRLPTPDSPADVVVHHQRGGGKQSHRLLRQIRVREEISERLKEQITLLPDTYDAIHIRATDYTTDTKTFLRRVKRRIGSRPVLLSSDNPSVAQEAEEIFTTDQLLTLPSPDLVPAGTPLHDPDAYSSNEQKLLTTTSLLRDVAAMSRATHFFYTFIDQPGKFGEPRLSGLTSLVSFLVQNPDVRAKFLGLPETKTPQRAVLVAPPRQQIAARLARRRRKSR